MIIPPTSGTLICPHKGFFTLITGVVTAASTRDFSKGKQLLIGGTKGSRKITLKVPSIFKGM